jgi:zinc transport system ATP-binding protein
MDPAQPPNPPAAHDPHRERACCTRLVDMGVRLGSTVVLEKVNLHVHCGELTAIVGPNGAGKTTLLRAILGEIRHTGQLVFLPAAAPANPQRPRIGYVPQRMEIDKTATLTVMDLFAAARTRWPIWLGHPRRVREEAQQALAHVRADDLLDRRLGHLSCGQLQRVLLALALTPVPELLLLDEPLAGMDHAGTAQFYETVSGLRRILDLSILLVSHDLKAAAAIADRMVFLNRTLLCEGTPAEVLRQPAVRESFGLDADAAAEAGERPAAPALCPFAQEEGP